MKRTLNVLTAAAGLLVLAGATSPQGCGDGASAPAPAAVATASSSSGTGSAPARFRTSLGGYDEIPALSTTGSGTFRAELSADGLSVAYELQYADLQGDAGGGAVTAAHIHLGQRGVAGGVAVHLCGGGGGTEPCPAPPATVTGTFAADQVVGPTGQGIDPGELEELLRAMRAGATYVNVHTTLYPSGEIRGQIGTDRRGGDHGGDGDAGSADDD